MLMSRNYDCNLEFVVVANLTKIINPCGASSLYSRNCVAFPSDTPEAGPAVLRVKRHIVQLPPPPDFQAHVGCRFRSPDRSIKELFKRGFLSGTATSHPQSQVSLSFLSQHSVSSTGLCTLNQLVYFMHVSPFF